MEANARTVAGAAAAIVLVSRIKDVQHVPRLVLGKGSPSKTLAIWSSALAIFGYERLVASILRRLGLTRIPSTLAAMLSIFAALRTQQKLFGKASSESVANLLRPGVDFLGKWMGLFLAPPLVSLDASIKALPPYSSNVWGKSVALLSTGWAATHSVAAGVATQLVPRRATGAVANPSNGAAAAGTGRSAVAPVAPVATAQQTGAKEVPLDEAIRRAWVVLGAVGYLGVACSPMLPRSYHRPLGMLCQLSTTVGSFALSKLLPDKAQRVLHPIVICAVTSNLASRYVGSVSPYFDAGRGVGDRLFQWLPAAVTGLGVRMYSTTDKWLDRGEDFRCVLATCCVSGCFSILGTAFAAISPKSPLSVPAPLGLPLLHRSVMSALGIEGSMAIGPECDPKLAVASILITGCIGASLGRTLLEAFPMLFDTSSPLVRGISMGCSAHSIGTAGLISDGDTDAAAIAGASMCLSGTVHTAVLQMPGLVPFIRALAGLA